MWHCRRNAKVCQYGMTVTLTWSSVSEIDKYRGTYYTVGCNEIGSYIFVIFFRKIHWNMSKSLKFIKIKMEFMKAISFNSQEKYKPSNSSYSQIGYFRESFCLCGYNMSLHISLVR